MTFKVLKKNNSVTLLEVKLLAEDPVRVEKLGTSQKLKVS